MLKTNNKMFQAEMENLELGLNLSSSDLLLFPNEDLLNIPIDQQTNLGYVNKDEGMLGKSFADILGEDLEVFADVRDFKPEHQTNDDPGEDLLAKIINEVKLPKEVEMKTESDVTFWPVNEDTSFVQVPDQNEAVLVASSPHSSYSDSSNDDTQTLIDEMEDFLVRHESNKSPEEVHRETKDAEDLLDALMSGNINMDDSGYGSINNISEVQMDDGQNVIIVIANDMEEQKSERPVPSVSPALSYQSSSSITTRSSVPSPVSSSYQDSDSDWSPAESKKRIQNKSDTKEKKKRGPYKRSKPYNIKDRKERKKMQNVVAARRYRDKKKNEQMGIEEEEQKLEERNSQLIKQVKEMEAEMKTLKKLMVELGLVKVL